MGDVWSQLTAYLGGASGSIPLFLIASKACAEARKSISCLESSMSPEPATIAAENVWTNWISGARLPARSTRSYSTEEDRMCIRAWSPDLPRSMLAHAAAALGIAAATAASAQAPDLVFVNGKVFTAD